MFHSNPQDTNQQLTMHADNNGSREDGHLRWLVTLATILMLGVASVGLSACDSEGTGTDQAAPPPADDSGTITQ